MIDAEELEHICRLCLANKDKFKIFLAITEDQKDKFEEITELQLPLASSLPTNICSECSDQLEKFFFYKRQLIRKQNELLQYLKISDEQLGELTSKLGSDKDVEEDDCIEELFEENTEDDDDFEMETVAGSTKDLDTGNIEDYSESAAIRSEDIEYCDQQPKLVLTPNFLKAREAIKQNQLQSSVTLKYMPVTLITNNSEKAVFICGTCNIEFSSEAEAKLHMSDHKLDAGGRQCDFCHLSFKTLRNYEKHVETAHSNMKFVCQVCGKVFDSKIQHRSHLRNHDQTLRYPCPVEDCTKAFRVKHHLNNHLRVHTKDSPFECSYEGCSAKFRQKHALTIHMRKHTGDYMTCDSCKSPFVTQFQLNKHLKTCNGTYKPLLTRTSRSESSQKNSKSELEAHVAQSHPSNADSTLCVVCSQVFDNRLDLKSHKCDVPQAACSICNYNFKDEESLSNHMLEYHGADEL